MSLYHKSRGNTNPRQVPYACMSIDNNNAKRIQSKLVEKYLAYFEGSMMDNRAVGEILKKRIKEMGYNQEDFANEIGISYETLKNYLNGTSPYSTEYLIKFAEKLDCSFDFLLGNSKATKNENHILVEELGLSNQAIEKIKELVNSDNIDCRDNMIQALEKIICKDGLLYVLALYILANKEFVSLGDKVKSNIISEPLPYVGLEAQKTLYISMIIAMLTEMREESKGELFISEELKQAINKEK